VIRPIPAWEAAGITASGCVLTDTLSKEHRSWNMGRIPSKDTKPEKIVRSLLYRMGFRFRVHVETLPGRPDIVLRRFRTVIFVHGCFWHRHPGCRYAYSPKSRTEFWEEKFARNVVRDQDAQAALACAGWRVATVWECETRDLTVLADRLKALLGEPGASGQSR
jgi:DNA mismatch endonuclease, patch repair protein